MKRFFLTLLLRLFGIYWLAVAVLGAVTEGQKTSWGMIFLWWKSLLLAMLILGSLAVGIVALVFPCDAEGKGAKKQ